MWFLAERFVEVFSEVAEHRDWRMEEAEDDEFIIFAKPVTSEIMAELGLDLTERDFGLSLNPTISVRHSQVSGLHARFFGFEHGVSQVAASLSDLARAAGRGGGVMWTVESADEVHDVVGEVLNDVSELGQPFFSRYSSVSSLVRHLEESAKTNLDLAQLSIAYALAGDLPAVDSVLSQLDEVANGQPSPIATQTTRFLTAFRAHFSDRG